MSRALTMAAAFAAVAGLVWFAQSGRAGALIDPNFTPLQLEKQCAVILRLELAPPGEKGECAVKVLRAHKGEAPAGLALRFDWVMEKVQQDARKAFGEAKSRPALLFAGEFGGIKIEGARDELDEERAQWKPAGLLLIGAAWFTLYQSGGAWVAGDGERLNPRAVWAGGERTLEQVLEYIREHREKQTGLIPSETGATWGPETRLAAPAGPVHGCLALELIPGEKPVLLVLGGEGDRAFQHVQGTEFKDCTAALKLTGKSRLAACADFDGDGRLDLANWDGEALRLRLRAADGSFASRPVKVTLEKDCRGLAALDVGQAGRAGLLVSGTGAPLLLVPAGEGEFEKRALPAPSPETVKALGECGPCVVADFDNDGWADVAQPWTHGVLLYKGVAAGKFADPVKAAEGMVVRGLCGAFAGDYDCDGWLDLVVLGEEAGSGEQGPIGCTLLVNRGGKAFEEVVGESGEVYYIGKPQVVGGVPCDINNDGRQDFMVLYRAMGAQFFFNRGFRCFGSAIPLDFAQRAREPGSEAVGSGQQAGAVADLNGDGAEDLAAVAKDGELWVFLREAEKSRKLGLKVSLPAACAGPVRVTGRDASGPLGARNLAPGAPVLFGKPRPGPLNLKWRFPGGQEQSAAPAVIKPSRLELTAGGR